MNAKVREQVLRRQRRVTRRLEQSAEHVGTLHAGRAHFETSDRVTATSAGGVRLAHDLAQALRLPQELDERGNRIFGRAIGEALLRSLPAELPPQSERLK